MLSVPPRQQKRQQRRFRHGAAIIVGTAAGAAVFIAGAVYVALSEPSGWLAPTLAMLAIFAAIGFVDVITTTVWLDDEQLHVRSGLRTRSVPRPAIAQVEWSAGSPVSLRTPEGWLRLPPLGDTKALADAIRQWLRAAPST